MPHFVFHFVRRGDGLLNLFAHKVAKLTAQSMDSNLDCALRHTKLGGGLCISDLGLLACEIHLEVLKVIRTSAACLFAQPVNRSLEQRHGPPTVEDTLWRVAGRR